jgi:signal transduction histidine kinase
MSIRGLLGVLLSVASIVGIGVILLSMWFLQGQLLTLFPPDSQMQVFGALRVLLVGQAIVLTVFAAVVLFVLFVVLGRHIAKPIRSIAASMKEFALTGKHLPVEGMGSAPKEIRSLAESFMNFADSVEHAHEHDTEVSMVKSDFISTAAHQLRTPLTGIRWALEALEKEQLSEGQQALVKSAVDKSHDLVDIVGTLLDISSIESGKYKYTFVPMDMAQLVEEVAKDFSPLAQQAQVALFYAKTGSGLPQVRADRERIKWILNNLIENAIRYTPPGGSVRLFTESTRDQVRVLVKDTGIGISTKDRGNIFERFYRAPNAITKQNQGNGLGLYIARTIATDHHGDLNFAQNTEGTGTTFTLSLPAIQSS